MVTKVRPCGVSLMASSVLMLVARMTDSVLVSNEWWVLEQGGGFKDEIWVAEEDSSVVGAGCGR